MTRQRLGRVSRRGFLVGGPAWMGSMSLGALSPAAAAKPPARGDVEALLRKYRVPAVSVAAFEGNEITLEAAYGHQKAGGDPATPETRFQAASISKTANALCVLSLVRDGKLDLDEPVNRRLTSWRLTGEGADKVTPRMLLSHTGGTTVHGFAGYERDDVIPTVIDILNGRGAANSQSVVVDAPPGRKFRYSGGGITILQRMVLDIETGSYHDIVAQRVLQPLGMSNSSMQQPRQPLSGKLAFGHTDKGETVRMDYHIYPEMAAAGLWTTPGDLARMLMALVGAVAGQDGAFLPKKLARQMITPVRSGAGLGVFIDNAGMINHSGVNWGFRAIYVANPRKRRGKIVMSNGENGEALNKEMLKRI